MEPFSIPSACRPRLAACLAFMFILVLPSLAGADLLARSFEREALNEQIVLSTYENLLAYTESSDVELSIEIDDFMHLYPADFKNFGFLDVVSPSEGLLIEMHRELQNNKSLGQSRVIYRPSIKFVAGIESPDTATLRGLSIDDAIQEFLKASPMHNIGATQSLTIFKVSITIDGKARSYNAAFAWMPARNKSMNRIDFLVLDRVTQGVEEAARESVRSLKDRSFLSRTRETRLGSVASKVPGINTAQKSGDICIPSSSTTTVNFNDFDPEATDHGWGNHYAEATLEITCACDTACNNTCEPSISNRRCYDDGWPATGFCHVMQSKSDFDAQAAYKDPSTCGVGYICGQKGCFFCTCGVTVGVTVTSGPAETNVAFASGDTAWSSGQQLTRICPPCEVRELEDDDSPGDGDGSNGGDAGDDAGDDTGDGGVGDAVGGGGNGGGGSGGGGGGGDNDSGDGPPGGGGSGDNPNDGSGGSDGSSDGSDGGSDGSSDGSDGGNDGSSDGGGTTGDGGGSGGQGGGGGGGGSFPVFCDGEYAGEASSLDEALSICDSPIPDLGDAMA